jgi:lipoate-protein ligase A
MTTHEESIESIYSQIKEAFKSGKLNDKDWAEIEDLKSELFARAKEEDGE